MKLTNSDFFTYPIIREYQSDLNTTLTSTINLNPENEILVDINTDSKYIEGLIEKHKAGAYIHLFSKYMPLRKLINVSSYINKGQVSLEVDKDYIINQIEVTPLLIARENMKINYGEELLEEDYVFNVQKGQKLGFNETSLIDVREKDVEVNKLFFIHKTNDPVDNNTISLSSNGVSYRLIEAEYLALEELINNPIYRKLALMPIYVSIYSLLLMEVTKDVEAAEEDHADKKWYQHLIDKCEKNNVNLDNCGNAEIAKYAALFAEVEFKEVKDKLGAE